MTDDTSECGSSTFTVVVPVGPGAVELARLNELLVTVRTYSRPYVPNGGAYAVSGRLLAHASSWDWRPYAQANLGEDVVVGLHCAAAGLRMRGMVDPGDPFGVGWKGLPAAPPELVGRGFSVIHSVKSGQYGSEDELRAWFRAHAGSPTGRGGPTDNGRVQPRSRDDDSKS